MGSLNWTALQKRFDKSNVLGIMLGYPEQIIEGIKTGKKISGIGKKFSNIVFCGMGGSGMAGLIAKQLVFEKIKIPIEVIEDYSLPAYVDSRTLVVAISFSGNTEEPLACFQEAKKAGAYAVAIASSGALLEIAEEKILVPKLSQPRLGTISMTVPLVFLLEKAGLIKSMEKELAECAEFLESEKNAADCEAKKIALKLKGGFPVVQAPASLGVLSYRFRVELNENAKILALSNVLPEMNHNEINSEDLPKHSCFVFLRTGNESVQMRKRFEFTKKVFKKFPQIEIQIRGKNIVQRMFYGVQLLALSSYYLALLDKKDPNEIPVIGALKKELKR